MNNMLSTIVPKSDQLNADSLIAKTITIKVTRVSLLGGDQPVALNYEGDEGKPYKPCKSMRRVLVHVWGSDGNQYIGRSLTLYRDEKVTFGGAAVGGIRISHMSDITEPVTMALTATRANRKPFTVKPLVATSAPVASQELLSSARAKAALGTEQMKMYWESLSKTDKELLTPIHSELKKTAADADIKKTTNPIEI